jgi:hypothetical protein
MSHVRYFCRLISAHICGDSHVCFDTIFRPTILSRLTGKVNLSFIIVLLYWILRKYFHTTEHGRLFPRFEIFKFRICRHNKTQTREVRCCRLAQIVSLDVTVVREIYRPKLHYGIFFLSNVVAVWLALLIRIPEVPDSILAHRPALLTEVCCGLPAGKCRHSTLN